MGRCRLWCECTDGPISSQSANIDTKSRLIVAINKINWLTVEAHCTGHCTCGEIGLLSTLHLPLFDLIPFDNVQCALPSMNRLLAFAIIYAARRTHVS